MKNISINYCQELSAKEMKLIDGGGPILDAIEWYYKTVGSFYKGLWDGLVGKDPII